MAKPEKKKEVALNVCGVPIDLLEKIDKAAEADHRSRSSFIVHKMWELFEGSKDGRGGGGNRTRE